MCFDLVFMGLKLDWNVSSLWMSVMLTISTYVRNKQEIKSLNLLGNNNGDVQDPDVCSGTWDSFKIHDPR